jgi:hypothetical protein
MGVLGLCCFDSFFEDCKNIDSGSEFLSRNRERLVSGPGKINKCASERLLDKIEISDATH